MNTDRLQKERSFHDDRFSGDDGERKNARKYYSVNGSLRISYIETISEHCEGKKLLEYGCGTGSGSKEWLELGAIVTGIDISHEGIKKAKEKIASSEYDADYFVMNAEDTAFEDNSFDIVVGTGIIHHLDLVKSYQELSRIIRVDGHIVFSEPLGHNPFINLYRTLTPKMRTEDEHPLKREDIQLLEDYFHNIKIDYFSLFTLFAVPFKNMFFFHGLCDFLRKVDKAAFRIPFIRKYAWMVIIHASNPKRIPSRL
ncbi:MAG: class I SAM-dependent methyltransferase [Pseudomonadales bacterium]